MQAALISVLCFLAVIGLTFIVSLIRAPNLLDEQRQAEIHSANTRIAEQTHTIEILDKTVAKPERTPVEQHYYEMAKTALEKHGEVEERAILRLVHSHGEMRTADWHVPQPNPEGVDRIKVRMILDALAADHLVVMQLLHTNTELVFEEVWTIPPAMKSALEELLYPESSSESSHT